MGQVEISFGPLERYIRQFMLFYKGLDQKQKIAFFAAIAGIILIIVGVILW